VSFEVERAGEQTWGIAPGIDRRHLRRLKRGEVPIDRRLDLHGMDARRAKTELVKALVDAYGRGQRCVLVVHGRGQRSEGGPVLKSRLVRWLEAAPLGEQVMAFATAQGRDGGAGASYVLLRRNRG
jgi:DNA-nicking Smr family endonuclease